MDRQRFRLLVWMPIFLIAAWPTAQLALDLLAGHLPGYRYHDVVRDTGLWASRWLAASLLISPIATRPGLGIAMRLRRMIALWGAAYVALHLWFWALDNMLVWDFLVVEVAERTYLWIGLVAALLLVPLAATSFKAAIRALGGSAWSRLHQLSYPAIALGWVHFWLATGPRSLEMQATAAVLAGAFLWRLARWWPTRSRAGRPVPLR